MTSLESVILSGRIVDLMLVFIALEIVLFAWLRRHRRGAFGLPALLVNIGAGASLMLALRASLTQSDWHWIAVFLVAALVFHLADVAGRWRSGNERDEATAGR